MPRPWHATAQDRRRPAARRRRRPMTTGAAVPPPAVSSPGEGHRPVLLAEVLDAIAPRDGDVIVDGTFGRGGYARAFLDAAGCSVIAIDRDPAAVATGQALAAAAGGRLTVLEGSFARMDELVAAV